MADIDHPINRGASAFMRTGPGFSPLEYTGYRDEILGSKNGAYLGTSLCDSPIYEVSGPDVERFLSSVCVNDFSGTQVGSIRHAVICNAKGQIMTDGVAMKIGTDRYRTYWLQPVIDFLLQRSGMDVRGEDQTGQHFFYQLAGPRSLEILEHASQSDLHDIRFATHRTATIDGVETRILRLGMAGTLAYEIHGPWETSARVYEAIWQAGQRYGIKKLGRIAYCMNRTEAGFPNIHIHYPLPWYEDSEFAAYLDERPGAGFFNENRKLIGSVGEELEVRFKTPFDLGWGRLVNFDHDFIGKAALQQIAANPRTTVVTLEWNADDIAEVFASQFRGREVEPCHPIERPGDLNFNLQDFGARPGGIWYHADWVLSDGKRIGTSTGRIHSVYYQRMLSLGFIDKEHAVEGKQLMVLWGGLPGTPQKEIRVTVARFPYLQLEHNRAIDVEAIPRYQPGAG
ncbi:MAG: hypothetical protein RBS88_06195 [Spongiibacteraceae bacterium]|jgi:glycine cleavage system aminomethyltransferase T|nr:hypothetical protein [Spongiibacteraceae bacterium]